jgi:hypothetical protein
MGRQMFEIHKRHNPVFILSEIKQLAKIFTEALHVNDTNMPSCGIDVIDIAQTVRINEISPFIVRSTLPPEDVISLLNKNTALRQLRDNPAPVIENLVKKMVSLFEIDSYLSMGENAPVFGLEKIIPSASISSKKPLVIFNGSQQRQPQFIKPEWYEMDHPALWMGRDWIPAMSDTEAFFAMSPEFKLEESLNRYQPLERFGDFSVGLVRF